MLVYQRESEKVIHFPKKTTLIGILTPVTHLCSAIYSGYFTAFRTIDPEAHRY